MGVNWTTVITSIISSTVLSAIISAIVSVWLKRVDYRNDYYKKIIEKRLAVYQEIERQIAILKSSVMDRSDGRAYYAIFAFGNEHFVKYQGQLMLTMSENLWLSDRTITILEDLNRVLFEISIDERSENDAGLIELGKDKYHEIAKIRVDLEDSVRTDFYSLHDSSRFMKTKKPDGLRILS